MLRYACLVPGRAVTLALASAIALVAAATPGHAATALGFDLAQQRAAQPAAPIDTVLKGLPAGQEELTFRGENAARTFTVVLGRIEASRTSVFQMSLLNAVSLLPERSTLKVIVNGTVVSSVAPAAADKPMQIAVRIPPGLLVPGANTVQLRTALTHRVDCSIAATYELWAMLDPAQTGFVVPRDSFVVHTLDDLSLAPLAEDGTTRIHLRMDDGADTAAMSRAGRFIGALVRRAGLARPVVDVGPDEGSGPGFDVSIGERLPNGGAVNVVARDAGVVIARGAATGRLVVAAPDANSPELDRAIDALANRTAARTQTLQDGIHKTFAELGLATDSFAGRHFQSTLAIDLPADFLAANDRARLRLDGGHASSLVEGSTLLFRVNGTLVSSMPLAAGRAERFEHAVIELPLRFFHPGHNDLSIEGMTAAVADQQCETLSMAREPRLTIASSSELDFPSFPRLVTMPQIPAAFAYDPEPSEGTVAVYIPTHDRESIGAGLTVVANTAGKLVAPDIRFSAPSDTDAPGIVIAPFDGLPDYLAAAVRDVTTPATDEKSLDEVDAAATAGASPAAADAATPDVPTLGMPLDIATLSSSADTAVVKGQALLRGRGFFFAGDRQSDRLAVSRDATVVAAVAPWMSTIAIGNVALPRFTRDPAQWLVVAAADAPTYQKGVNRLVSSGRWTNLAGQAASFDLDGDTLHILQPRTIRYVVPTRFVSSDIRPILGGIVSDNVLVSIGVLFTLMTLLGFATHVMVRRTGAR